MRASGSQLYSMVVRWGVATAFDGGERAELLLAEQGGEGFVGQWARRCSLSHDVINLLGRPTISWTSSPQRPASRRSGSERAGSWSRSARSARSPGRAVTFSVDALAASTRRWCAGFRRCAASCSTVRSPGAGDLGGGFRPRPLQSVLTSPSVCSYALMTAGRASLRTLPARDLPALSARRPCDQEVHEHQRGHAAPIHPRMAGLTTPPGGAASRTLNDPGYGSGQTDRPTFAPDHRTHASVSSPYRRSRTPDAAFPSRWFTPSTHLTHTTPIGLFRMDHHLFPPG